MFLYPDYLLEQCAENMYTFLKKEYIWQNIICLRKTFAEWQKIHLWNKHWFDEVVPIPD
jgi:hypothetical protein